MRGKRESLTAMTKISRFARNDDTGAGCLLVSQSLIPAFKLGFKAKNGYTARWRCNRFPRETLMKSLSDFTLGFLCMARNNLTRIASYLRKVMTKLCIKILVKSDSAI